jgi:hypothetical protein
VVDGETPPWSTEGPVQAEVFVLAHDGEGIQLAGPCGPDAWYLEVGADEDPVAVVTRLTRSAVGEPLLVHSTSWRRARGSVILSFVVVIPPALLQDMAGVRITRAALARSDATEAPARIAHEQVIEHGLRHLAWLARDDSTVQAVLDDAWLQALQSYVPEPFRNLGSGAPGTAVQPRAS